MKCYHHNDLDGRCAGAILKKALKEPINFIEMDYKDEVNIDEIEPEEEIYILDFSFKPDVMNKILKKTKNITWIDHHKTAFEYEKKYNQKIEGIRSSESSACELTWVHFDTDNAIPYAVLFIGDYDTWEFKLSGTEEFHYGLLSYDNSPMSDIWDDLLNYAYDLDYIKDRGQAVIEFRDQICDTYRKYGYEIRFEGWLAYVMNLHMFGSLAFNELMFDYPICIGFVFDGEKYMVSLYSREIDVSEIAKKYDGGGHKGAAGFVCRELPFKINKPDGNTV